MTTSFSKRATPWAFSSHRPASSSHGSGLGLPARAGRWLKRTFAGYETTWRHSMSSDEAVRRAALTRLALATKELLPERKEDRDAFFRIYLDGLADYQTHTVVAVCRNLETRAEGGWFPKLPVLCEAMRAYVRMKRDQARPVYQIQGKPLEPEKLARFKDDVAAHVRRMRMR